MIFDFNDSKNIQSIITDVNRFYCDVERLENDILEQWGNGIIYTKSPIGIERNLTDEKKQEILNTIYYPDGTPIPEIIDLNANGSTDDEWASLDDHDDVYYTSEDATFGSYGKLYTWTAAMGRDTLGSNIIYKTVQGVCPDGWHLPSTGEWRTLEEYIGNYGPSSSGIALKSTTGWIDGGNGVDSYGFSAYPTGVIAFPEGNFVGSGEESSWWSSTEGDHDYYHTFIGAYFSKIAYDNPNLNIVGGVNGNFKQRGLSVRCIKDELE